MAFIRVEKKKSGSYIRIVETYRESGKVRQRILASLGKQEDYTPEMLKRMGERLYELGGGNIEDLLGEGIEELGRYNYGFVEVVRLGLQHFDLIKIFNRVSEQKKLSYGLNDVVTLLLCERLNEPGSKLSNYTHQQEYLDLNPVKLQHIYRSLNHLAKHSELIQQRIFHTGRNLFNSHLDVVFYDVTTFYFDSETEDGFREKGFGKDGKIGKTQIVFGLLIDKDKNPVGYQIYKGSQYEGHTLVDAIKKLEKRYHIENVIVVADRGMLSKKNLELVSKHYEFIVGERLKSLPTSIQNQLLAIENYQCTWTYNKKGQQISLKYQTLEYNRRTIIATYSEKRARKDAKEREGKLEKAKKLQSNPSLLKQKAKRYYLKQEEEGSYTIDQERIAQDQKYDGFIAICTNAKNLEASQILDHYRHLFQIEHTFRTFKSHLEVRPMFHWTQERIEGHMAMCYIAYAIENYILKKLDQKGVKISENKLQRLLEKMQVSHIKQGRNEYYLRSRIDGQVKNVIQKLGLKEKPNLSLIAD